ncbi:MAG: site-2 protease family protein [Nanoarchaeota archaeon]|nr:site-2 protease family protein [Nanoarchaeota archaeon]
MFKLKKIPIKVWILIAVLFLSLLAINPSPRAEGIEIKSIEQGPATENGLATGQIITSINGYEIKTLADFKRAVEILANQPRNISIKTDAQEFEYQIRDDLGFIVDENLTVMHIETDMPLEQDEKIISINGRELNNYSDFKEKVQEILPNNIYKIVTKETGEVAFLAQSLPQIKVKNAATSNIKKGLDLQGGTRVLLKPVSKDKITDGDIADLIKVLSNRLNVYGLSDLRIRSAEDWGGEKFVLVEIAGASRGEVKDLIAQQGRFEAKIGDEVVFTGGKKDIPFVCRNDGTCSGIKGCNSVGDGFMCRFEFAIHLSPDAAKQHANVTKNIAVIETEDGREILEKNIDFYLDGALVDSLNVGSDLKGSETTNIAISGPGSGATKDAALDSALKNMDKLQTVLITGSLPFDLEIVKLDSISPLLGKSFIKNSLIAGLFALLGVAVVIYIRYRKIKILIPMILTIFSELIIILGFAALIGWNLDIPAIAGIIAAIGTGVDHLIVIIDETITGRSEFSNWKKKLKSAFYIIFVAYATTVAALIPLWNAGAGLIRGFAITTIAGISIGVFLTRPAFGAIAEKMFKE